MMMGSATPAPGELKPIASDEALDAELARLGEIERTLAKLGTEKAAAIAKAGRPFEDKATPLQTEEVFLRARIEAYSVANRERILASGKKEAEFPSGKVGWRMGQPSIEVAKDLEAKAIEAVKGVRGWYKRFVKVTEALSKRALGAATPDEKKALAKIKGIVFHEAKEAFWIEPAGGELATRPEAAPVTSDQ